MKRDSMLDNGAPIEGIIFEDVSFTYPKSQRPLYEKLKLTIRAGERVGLVGASGAGKTTLVSFYNVTMISTPGAFSWAGRTSRLSRWRRCAARSESWRKTLCCSIVRSART